MSYLLMTPVPVLVLVQVSVTMVTEFDNWNKKMPEIDRKKTSNENGQHSSTERSIMKSIRVNLHLYCENVYIPSFNIMTKVIICRHIFLCNITNKSPCKRNEKINSIILVVI